MIFGFSDKVASEEKLFENVGNIDTCRYYTVESELKYTCYYAPDEHVQSLV